MAPASKLTARVRRLGLEKGPTVGTSNLRLRFRVRRILRRLKGADVEDEKDLKAVHAYLAHACHAPAESRFWAALNREQQLELCRRVRWQASGT
jgi:hypothetical protein